MAKIMVLPVLAGVFFLFFSAPLAQYAHANTCIDCHTSDSSLKSLYKPPPAKPSEGEG
jgi:hypothetical protein